MTWFYNLAKLGSVNATPVYLFILALKGPSRKSFLKAIDACAEADMVHLEAPARERFAAFLRTENNLELAKEQITSSYWLYRDWGAYAKALDLSQQYVFIKVSYKLFLFLSFVTCVWYHEVRWSISTYAFILMVYTFTELYNGAG